MITLTRKNLVTLTCKIYLMERAIAFANIRDSAGIARTSNPEMPPQCKLLFVDEITARLTWEC